MLSGYLPHYDRMLMHLVHEPLTVLEMGVLKGGSLQLWRDYFPRATVIGIDLRPAVTRDLGERVKVYQGSQSDSSFLGRVAAAEAPEGFDIVIDDASHIGTLSRTSFWTLFDDHLKPGGWYVIEDWGTGYWNDWPDGKAAATTGLRSHLNRIYASMWRFGIAMPLRSHQYGMVGFVKELIDEQGAADLSKKRSTGVPARQSRFESITVYPALVFIQKRIGATQS
jgi:hypothetical protein